MLSHTRIRMFSAGVPPLPLAVVLLALLGRLILSLRLPVTLFGGLVATGVRAVGLVTKAGEAHTKRGRAPAAGSPDQLDTLEACHRSKGE